MARRFQRRSRGTWLPTLGTQLVSENELFLSGYGGAIGNPDPYIGPPMATDVFPLTTDEPLDGDDIGNTTRMSEVIGNEYFLDRVVGKFFASYTPSIANGASIGPILVCAGMFVARVSEANKQVPVGLTNSLTASEEYGPLEWDNIREPWLWRRTWCLGTHGSGGIAGAPGNSGCFPQSTAQYGSVADGPHIDAKTKRRVGQDDRLFLAVSTAYAPLLLDETEGPVETAGTVAYYLDYRLHGQLRRARQTGRF